MQNNHTSDPAKLIAVHVGGDPALELYLYHVALEFQRAMELFPGRQQNLAAATEEHGEMAQALLDHERGEVRAQAVWEEAVQAAAMAGRVALQGSMEFKYATPTLPQPASYLKLVDLLCEEDTWEKVKKLASLLPPETVNRAIDEAQRRDKHNPPINTVWSFGPFWRGGVDKRVSA